MDYQDGGGCMAECIEVYELFNFGGESEEHGVHDVGEVAGEFQHVFAGFVAWFRCHPKYSE